MTVKEQIAEVNALLERGEPHNISVDDHGSTTYTGYKPQAVIDAMNAVFLETWGFDEISSELRTSNEGNPTLVVAKMQVWIDGLKNRPVSWGQNRITRGDEGDARKAAQTDAIKKALSYFSIGNRAYLGLLENPKGAQNGQKQHTRAATNGGAQPTISQRILTLREHTQPLVEQAIAPQPLPDSWWTQVLEKVFGKGRIPQSFGEEHIVKLETYKIQLEASLKRKQEATKTV